MKEIPMNSVELLIEHYETSMRQRASRSSHLAVTLSSLGGFEQVVDGLIETLEREVALNSEEERISQQPVNSEESNTCESPQENEVNTFEDSYSKFNGAEAEIYANIVEKEKANKFEDCWGCDLRPVFDWQVKPVNFLSEIEELLESIDKAIDHFIESTNPENMLEEFCPIFDIFDSDFNWMCGADLIALLSAIQLALARYMDQAVSIGFNWVAALGPLIKFIADGLSASLETIKDILLAPIICIKNVLTTADQIQDEFQELAAVGVGLGQSLGGLRNVGGAETYRSNVEGYPNPGNRNNAKKEGFPWQGGSFNYQADLDDFLGLKKNKYRDGLFKNAAEKYSNAEVPKDGIIPLLGKEDGYLDRKNLRRTDEDGNPISLLKKMILVLNTSQNFINQKFANLILSIKSLNSMIVGNLGLHLKLSGIILFLIDFANMIRIWIEMNKLGGVKSFADLCKDYKNDDEGLYSKFKHPWFNYKSKLREDFDKKIKTEDLNTCESKEE